MEKLDGKSLDLTKENINTLKKLFPEVVTEGKIDFVKLKLILGDEIDDRDEKYEFTWHGKAKSMKLAQKPSTGTLRPDKASSKNWDTTENLFIEGDNLEVLKILQKSYFGKVKLIYIDPPYNTGKDFIYNDVFQENIKNYKKKTMQVSKANTEVSGRFHTDWLNMMYPRLKLARNMLTEDGIIFISIDDTELENLKKICNEIFGEDNFIETYIWESTFRPDNSSKINRKNAEYVLCYAKKIEQIEYLIGTTKRSSGLPSLTKNSMKESVLNFPEKRVKTFLNDGLYKKGKKESGYELLDDVIVKDGIITNSFRLKGRVIWGQQNLDKEIAKGTEIIIKSDGFVPYTKKNEMTFSAPNKIIPNSIVGDVLEGRSTLNRLFDNNQVFRYPKPVSLIKYFLGFINQKDYIVMDFFAGSATTAHAVLEKNKEDNGTRKFILVQLPEVINENENAYNLGYQTISEIAKDRIKRYGKQLEEDNVDVDIGFKVFKLDSSNIKEWDPDIANLEQNLFDLQDNIKEDRTKEDLLYEILLKIGIPLTAPIQEIEHNGKTIYNVGHGGVLLCLDDEIDLDIVNKMIELKPEDFDTKVIFKETGFLNDSVKTNAIQTLKKHGITDVRSV